MIKLNKDKKAKLEEELEELVRETIMKYIDTAEVRGRSLRMWIDFITKADAFGLIDIERMYQMIQKIDRMFEEYKTTPQK